MPGTAGPWTSKPTGGQHIKMTEPTDNELRPLNRAQTAGPGKQRRSLPCRLNGKDQRLKLPAAAGGGRPADIGTRAEGTASRTVSVSVSFTPVRGRSPVTAGRLPGLVRDAGGRWRTAVHSPRKRVKAQVFRGFKSHLHRH
jgi:hypothetical protein